MQRLLAVIVAAVTSAAVGQAQTIDVSRSGSRDVVAAAPENVQRWGDPVQEIRPGDVVRIPPGQKHWHGAAPTTLMTHLAVTEHLDGIRVHWMEKVSDEQYRGLSRGAGDQEAHVGSVRACR
jgi:hypothetical protein